jgi:hypothetical protein
MITLDGVSSKAVDFSIHCSFSSQVVVVVVVVIVPFLSGLLLLLSFLVVCLCVSSAYFVFR